MFVKSVIVVALAIGVAQGSVVLKDSVVEGLLKHSNNVISPNADASAYIDEILANVRDLIAREGYNSVPLPDTSFNFSQVILGVTWHGEAVIYEGAVGGFGTIHRTGIADLSVEPNGDIVIKVDAGIDQGSLGAKLSVKFMGMGPTATITGTIKNIAVKLGIRVNVQSKVAALEEFDIHNLGTLNIDVQGLSLLNFLIEIVANIFGNLVKNIVGELLQGVIKNLINDLIAKTLFPDHLVSLISALQQQAAIASPQLPIDYIYVH